MQFNYKENNQLINVATAASVTLQAKEYAKKTLFGLIGAIGKKEKVA